MEAKDAPEATKIKLTASNQSDDHVVDDVDDVVRPFVPNAGFPTDSQHCEPITTAGHPLVPHANNEIKASKLAGIVSVSQEKGSAKAPNISAKHFSQVRHFSIILGMLIAVSLCATMWKQRQVQEEQLHYYTDQAELAEFDDRPGAAASWWRLAIGVSESLHADRRALADLHIQAANAESSERQQLEINAFNKPGTNGPMNLNRQKKFRDDEYADLLAALRIYQHTANVRAEQIMTLSKLILLVAAQVPQGIEEDAYSDAYCAPGNDGASRAATTVPLPRYYKNDIEQTIANYRSYLIKGGNLSYISARMPSLIGLLKTPWQYETMIALLHEYVYRTNDPEMFLQGHKWLDQAIEKSGRFKEGRLVIANGAYAHGDLHAAIVEYSRYLADNENDERVRSKLLEVRRLNRQINVGSGPDKLLECISFLKQLRQLQGESFGYENNQTLNTTVRLANSYSVAEDVTSADQELAPLLNEVERKTPFKHTILGDFVGSDPILAPGQSAQLINYGNYPAGDIFRACASIEVQKAQYDSAIRNRERSLEATVWPASPTDRAMVANLCTCRGLYSLAQVQIDRRTKLSQDMFSSGQSRDLTAPVMLGE